MTGRKLYDHYCDATAKHLSTHRGGWNTPAGTPLPAWPSLSDNNRRRWSTLAARITPKPRLKVSA
jgi:hypothetical protein